MVYLHIENSAVSVVTRPRAELPSNRFSIPRRVFTHFRPNQLSRSPNPLCKECRRYFSPRRINQPGREADHSSPSTAACKNEYSCTAILPVCLFGVYKNKIFFHIYLKIILHVYDTAFMGGGWLRHCATSWKVAGSIPDCVIRIFHCTV